MKINFFCNKNIPEDHLQHLEDIICFCRNIIMKRLNQGQIISYSELLTFIENIESYDSYDFSFYPIIERWYYSLTQNVFLNSLLEGPNVTEIILHHPELLQYEENGTLVNIKIDGFHEQDYKLYLEILSVKEHTSWSFSRPFVSFLTYYKNLTFRASLLHESMTPEKKSKLFLRKIGSKELDLRDFTKQKTTQHYIRSLVKSKKNIIICGGTSSGKTSLLNVLLQKFPDNEHTIIIEDAHELISNKKQITHFLAQENSETKNAKNYCAHALRLRPDRLLLGEIRSNEIIPFFLAMNTGHRGLMCTLHANSAQDAIERMALLYSIHSEYKNISFETIKMIVSKNIDYVIHMNHREIGQIHQLNK